MLKHYDYFEEIFELESIRQKGNIRLNIIASELMENLGYHDFSEFNAALVRSFEVCTALKIPVKDNFRKFYKLRDEGIVMDWYLSDLAAYLITINGNTCNPNVAKAQLQFLFHLKNKP